VSLLENPKLKIAIDARPSQIGMLESKFAVLVSTVAKRGSVTAALQVGNREVSHHSIYCFKFAEKLAQ
jgi:hypothetical protein